MTEDEFWGLCPRTFDALLDRRREEHRREAVQFAVLRTDVINYSFARPREQVKVKDLLPWLNESDSQRQASAPRKLNRKLRAEISGSIRRFFGDPNIGR